jgi:putative tricarboxylic transport membrane protein
MKKADAICGIAAAAFAAWAFGMTFTFRQYKNAPMGPDIYPRAMAVGLFICAMVFLGQKLLIKGTSTGTSTSTSTDKKDYSGLKRLGIAFCGTIVYALLWPLAGFLVATPLFFFGFMFLLGMRRWLTMVIVSVAATAVVFLVFANVLGITMPLGFMEYWF